MMSLVLKEDGGISNEIYNAECQHDGCNRKKRSKSFDLVGYRLIFTVIFLLKLTVMGPLGFNEILVLAFILIVLIIVPIVVAYRLGKQKGRLMEMERQRQEELYKQKA